MADALRRRYRLTGILLLGLVLTGGYYFGAVMPAAEEARLMRVFESRFFHLDPGRIRLIQIRVGQDRLDIGRRGGGWVLAGTVPADQGAVDNLLDALADGRLIKVVGEGRELERFGLDRPEISVTVGLADQAETLLLGDTSPTGDGFYGYAGSMDRVFVVDREFVSALRESMLNLRERRIFGNLGEPVMGFRIERNNDTVEVARHPEGWRMISPFPGEGNTREINALISMIRRTKAMGFVPWSDAFRDIDWHLRLMLFGRGGRILRDVTVWFWGNTADTGMLIHEDGAPEAARVRREFWNALVAPASDWADRRLFGDGIRDASVLRFFVDDDWMEFRNDRGRWLADGTLLNRETIKDLISLLGKWNASVLTPERPENGKRIFAAEFRRKNRVVERLEVFDINRDYLASETSVFAIVTPGRPETEKVDFLLGRTSRLGPGVVIDSRSLKRVVAAIRKVGP